MNFKESLHYAANLVGANYFEPISRKEPKKSANIAKESDKPNNRMIERIAKEAVQIEGSLGERYLKEHRAIENTKAVSVKFHPNLYSHRDENKKAVYHPALVALALDETGEPSGMQAIYLDQKTGNKRTDLDIVKRSFGTIGGSHVIISEGIGQDKVSFIAEGVETAMSIREAVHNHQVIAVLGKSNFKNLDPNTLNKTIVLCLDNDKENTFLNGKVIKESIERLKHHGKEVLISIPDKPGYDFNDVLTKEGAKSVSNQLHKTITADEFIKEFNHINALKASSTTINKNKELLKQYPHSEINKVIAEQNIHKKETHQPTKHHEITMGLGL